MAIRGTRKFGISRENFFVRLILVTFSRKKRKCFAHLFFGNICCSEFDTDHFEPNFFWENWQKFLCSNCTTHKHTHTHTYTHTHSHSLTLTHTHTHTPFLLGQRQNWLCAFWHFCRLQGRFLTLFRTLFMAPFAAFKDAFWRFLGLFLWHFLTLFMMLSLCFWTLWRFFDAVLVEIGGL